MRLFVAIDLPENIRAYLAQMSFGLPGARWVEDEQIHLTLSFIGEVDKLLYQDIKKALFEVQIDPFDLALKGVGHFPPKGQPTVLWVGVEKSEPLLSLYHKVESILRQLGVETDRRKYSPHITLARLKDTPINRLGEFLTQHALFETEPFDVTEFHLYSSTLTQRGSIYAIEETYPLD